MSERVNPRSLEGCRRLVFDWLAWQQAGADVGDNSQFYKPATVKKVWNDGDDWRVDVVFDDGIVSRGHFVSGLRDLEGRLIK